MNKPVVAWCRQQRREVTRAGAYRRDDQSWREPNSSVIVRLVGCGRFEGYASAARWPGATQQSGGM